MKILILGAGQVGSSVAAALSVEDENQITVVDRDASRLPEATEKRDISTVTGHASLPSVLTQAGIDEADLLVAVTSSDEVNIIGRRRSAQQHGPKVRYRDHRSDARREDHPDLPATLQHSRWRDDRGTNRPAGQLTNARCPSMPSRQWPAKAKEAASGAGGRWPRLLWGRIGLQRRRRASIGILFDAAPQVGKAVERIVRSN